MESESLMVGKSSPILAPCFSEVCLCSSVAVTMHGILVFLHNGVIAFCTMVLSQDHVVVGSSDVKHCWEHRCNKTTKKCFGPEVSLTTSGMHSRCLAPPPLMNKDNFKHHGFGISRAKLAKVREVCKCTQVFT